MREKRSNWQRVEAVIKWANMTTNYFARYIGLARGENLYQIKRGNNGISLDVANRIVAKFPEVDKLWLLTGEGQMFSDNRLRGAQIPYYHVEVERGIVDHETLVPDGYLVVPPVGDCDFAMCYTGHAMGPSIPSGTVLLLKAVDRDAIIPGSEYVIVGRKIVTLRTVRTSPENERVRLVAGDRENYDDIVLNVNDIVAVYMVKGKLIVTN
ncbi:MAG TPA: S24 family peptidase [Candidatus Alistipes intestinipullorum]|nr:S24 family peptidase [Candidatus Alistipes intestinipullorum]